MKLHIPIRLPSLLNLREHWSRTIKLKQLHKMATNLVLSTKDIPSPPLTVTITRLGPRRLDDDNLAGACKYIRDAIANKVGIDDGSSQYTWIYKQAISRIYGIDVEIVSRLEECKSDAISYG